MISTYDRFKQIKKIGNEKFWLQDFYHSVLIIPWRYFFLIFLAFFIVFNSIFAYFYWIFPNSLSGTDNSFWEAFLFSVQTFSTVGYGAFVPQSDFAQTITVIESALSVFFTALLTGLTFSKFSRPIAKIIFSKNMLINSFDGNKILTFRMGNLRSNIIAEAQVRIVLLQTYKTIEGESIRRQIDLKLIRSSSLFFALTWSVMHIIDETSPLYNLTAEDILRENIEFAVSLIGHDSTFLQTVHANLIYPPDSIIFDRYFADVIESTNGKVNALRYDRFHDLKITEPI